MKRWICWLLVCSMCLGSLALGETAPLADAAEDRLEIMLKGWDALYEEHTADHRALMDRSDVSFSSLCPPMNCPEGLRTMERLSKCRC